MKINILLAVIFLSFTLLAFSGLFPIPPMERIGSTELNGDGCVCHSLYENENVFVWVEGPETLAVGQTGLYKMFLAGGPAEAGGYNVAGRYGTMGIADTLSVWDYRAPNELTQAFPLVFPTPDDTIFWPFEYTASDSSSVDTIYSCGLSIVYDAIPDSHDVWAFGPKFPITIIDDVTPVELIALSAAMKNNTAVINWRTASELNNKGFYIEKLNIKNQNADWEIIGFVEGKGTTTETSEYSFADRNIAAAKYFYRLKQTDYDGKYVYSDIVELNAEGLITDFVLNQNYPNPFNPSTTISWQMPKSSVVNLKIYDITGSVAAVLINERLEAGNHKIEFNAEGLSSGVYFYSLETDNLKLVKKMLLMK